MTSPNQRASTQRHFRVRVAINGQDLGLFDRRTGGGTTAEVGKHTPGSAPSAKVTLGGPRTTDDVTVGRDFVATRDHDLIRTFRPLVGLAEVTVTQIPLDKDGREFGRPEVWNGILAAIGPPDYDTDATDRASFDVVVVVDGDPS